MLLLLLLGCPLRTEVHCEFVDGPVADDERLDLGYTVAHVLAEMDPQRVVAVDLAGEAHDVEVTVTRGEADAVLTDAVVVEEVVGGVGPSTHSTWQNDDRRCEDGIAIPVALTVTSDDGAVSVSGDGTLTSNGEGERFFELAYDLAATDVLPAGLHGAATGGTLRAYFLQGELLELTAEVTAEDGAREIVLVHSAG
ncbi:MAG: hypothetical protein ACK4YP_09420 [Myxococcota bacterium]